MQGNKKKTFFGISDLSLFGTGGGVAGVTTILGTLDNFDFSSTSEKRKER
jgi:hypothetical protein